MHNDNLPATTAGTRSETSETGLARSIKGFNEIEHAITTGTMIKDLPDDGQIREALRYVFAILGIKGRLIPNEVEKIALLNSITKYFGSITPHEIRLAFEYAESGQLNIETSLFGDVFNFGHFSKIVNAYIEQRRRDVLAAMNKKATKKPEPTPEQKIKLAREFNAKCIMAPIEAHVVDNHPLDFGTVSWSYVLKLFRDSKLINIDKTEGREIRKRHQKAVEEEAEEITSRPAFTPDGAALRQQMKKALEGENDLINKQALERCHKELVERVVFEYQLTDIEKALASLLPD